MKHKIYLTPILILLYSVCYSQYITNYNIALNNDTLSIRLAIKNNTSSNFFISNNCWIIGFDENGQYLALPGEKLAVNTIYLYPDDCGIYARVMIEQYPNDNYICNGLTVIKDDSLLLTINIKFGKSINKIKNAKKYRMQIQIPYYTNSLIARELINIRDDKVYIKNDGNSLSFYRTDYNEDCQSINNNKIYDSIKGYIKQYISDIQLK